MPRTPDTEIPRLLLAWYKKNRRDLPWRRTNDPYQIWVSEIMLQQTRVETVIPYYERFLRRFPDVKALARARLDSVLKAWENLGYYSRARHLHEAARVVVNRFGGTIPATEDRLLELPGIGAYTAGAILSIAFGKPVAAVDGNVIRVISRLFGIRELVDRPDTKKKMGGITQRLVPPEEPGHFIQALMDLGSGICTPRSPDCPTCPVAGVCVAYRKGFQESVPAKKKAYVIPQRREAAVLIRNSAGEVLMIKRPQRGLLGGLWRFPGCAIERGEQPATKLRSCLRDGLGLRVAPGKEIFRIEHGYSHFSVEVHVFEGRIREGLTGNDGALPWRWVDPDKRPGPALSGLERKILRRWQTHRQDQNRFADGKSPTKGVK